MSSKQVDSIIDNAKNEQEAIAGIVSFAKKNHGEDVVNNLIETSATEEEANERLIKLARKPRQSSIEKYAVKGLQALEPIAKGVSMVTTPIMESVRGPFQYIAQNVGENTSQTPPIDPTADWNFDAPSGRGGLTNLLTDISNSVGIKQQPLAQVDIEGYPATSQALTQLSNPAEFTAALLEGMSGSKFAKIPGVEKMGSGARLGSIANDIGSIPGAKKLGNIASEFYPSSIMNPLTSRTNKRAMIANYVTEAAKDRGLLNEILENGQFEYMVDMLEQNPELIKPFNKKGALDLMEGPIQSQLNPETNRMSYRRAPEQGQLGKLAAQQGMIIDEIPEKYSVNREDFLASALNELPGGLDESQRASAEKLIRESVKPVLRDPIKTQAVERSMDLRNQIQEAAMNYGNEAEMIPNPDYRPELQWLSDLEVINDPNGNNIFPKNRIENTTTITSPKPEYTPISPVEAVGSGGMKIGYEPSGKVISPDASTSYIDTVQEFSNTADPLRSAPGNQSILDIAMGKQKIPKEIVNPKSIAMKNQVRQLMDDLMGVDDPTIPDMDAYNEFIYNLNQENAAPFLNQQRKTGNVYKDQISPFTDPRDVAARQLSGDALERAASEGLNQPMSELDNISRELYSDTNRGISTRRNYRDLLTGARAEKDRFGKVVPQGDIERGIVSRVLGSADEFVVPTGHKIANYLERQGIQYGTGASKLAPISLQSYRIPRNSEKMMEEKDYIVSKIGKELGPQYANDLMMIEDRDALKLFMRNIELTRPDLFEKDPYARFDGVIEHPVLKQKALDDTIKNNNVSVLDKANTVEELLLNNKFLG